MLRSMEACQTLSVSEAINVGNQRHERFSARESLFGMCYWQDKIGRRCTVDGCLLGMRTIAGAGDDRR
jgi:hypothetical protein